MDCALISGTRSAAHLRVLGARLDRKPAKPQHLVDGLISKCIRSTGQGLRKTGATDDSSGRGGLQDMSLAAKLAFESEPLEISRRALWE